MQKNLKKNHGIGEWDQIVEFLDILDKRLIIFGKLYIKLKEYSELINGIQNTELLSFDHALK